VTVKRILTNAVTGTARVGRAPSWVEIAAINVHHIANTSDGMRTVVLEATLP